MKATALQCCDYRWLVKDFQSRRMIRKNRKSSGLTRIHDAVIHVFQRKALPYSYYTLQSNLRRLIRTDTGPIIYDFFKDQLLKKGMVILRESLKSLKGAALLDKLSETWDYFFKEILLTLQAILYPFQDCPPEDVTISLRQLILADFRDTVLLKINLDVEEALEMAPVVPEPIKQMVLVLQGINDGISLEHQLKLERIVVRAVYPYLGVRGLYESGDTEPTIEASTAANISAKETEASKILLNALVHGRNATLLSLGSAAAQRSRYEVLPDQASEQVQCTNYSSTSGRKRLWPAAQSRHLSPSSKYSLPYSERRQVVSMTTQLFP